MTGRCNLCGGGENLPHHYIRCITELRALVGRMAVDQKTVEDLVFLGQLVAGNMTERTIVVPTINVSEPLKK